MTLVNRARRSPESALTTTLEWDDVPRFPVDAPHTRCAADGVWLAIPEVTRLDPYNNFMFQVRWEG